MEDPGGHFCTTNGHRAEEPSESPPPQSSGNGIRRQGQLGTPRAEIHGTDGVQAPKRGQAMLCLTAWGWPRHQGLCQPHEAPPGMAIKATAANTDTARKEYGEKPACLCFSDSSEDPKGTFPSPGMRPDSSMVQSGNVIKRQRGARIYA